MDPLRSTPAPNCDILNNSPALHSLKRQQLVQLCKRNGIKATGKNSEIIEKLKALKSPQDKNSIPLNFHSMASSDDEADKENRRIPIPRPSEAWTIIEEDSREVERVQLGLKNIREEIKQEMLDRSTLNGFDASTDFGSGTTSSKGSTRTLSLKAFASSFRRGGSKMSTTSTVVPGPATMPILPGLSTPPSQLSKPSPLPSPATFDPNESVDQSIIDMGEHTLRLVTTNSNIPSPPALRPFTPTFEATYSPSIVAKITPYPSLNAFGPETEMDFAIPGAFIDTASRVTETPKPPQTTSQATSPPVFIFGSPQHHVSNTQFNSAAAAVLAEMNSRLGLAGTDKEVGMELLQRHETSVPTPLFSHLEKKPGEITAKFDKAHEKQFQQMEGIGEWFARRAGDTADKQIAPLSKKRKSNVFDDPSRKPTLPSRAKGRRVSRVVTPATRKSLVADAEKEEAEERCVKRVKISNIEGGDPRPAEQKVEHDSSMVIDNEDGNTKAEREKERAAIRRRLEISRERRRSSMGKVTVGANKPPLIPNQPKKVMPSKFGFLSSAKSLVKSVWGIGSGTSTTAAAKPKVLTKPNPMKATTSSTLHQEAPKPSTLRVPSNSNLVISRKSSISTKAGTVSSMKTTTTSTSRLSSASSGTRRAPIPSFSRLVNPPKVAASSISRSNGTRNSGTSITGVSSIGAKKPSMLSGIGPNVANGSIRSVSAGRGSVNGYVRQRTSTLLAPTASSLAKLQSTVKVPSLSTRPGVQVEKKQVAIAEQVSPKLQDTTAFAFTSPLPSFTAPSIVTPAKPSTRIFANGTPSFAPNVTLAPPETGEATETPKPRSLSQRRPRISRSRVIARVGAQRATGPTPLDRTASGRRSLNAPRAKNSLSTNARASAIGIKSSRHSAALSARRKIRQSEIMRRRSKFSEAGRPPIRREGPTPEKGDGDDNSMDQEEAYGSSALDVPMEE